LKLLCFLLLTFLLTCRLLACKNSTTGLEPITEWQITFTAIRQR